MIVSLAVQWSWLKIDLETLSGISADLLHVYFGVILFLAPRLATRGRISVGKSWFALLALECLNEGLDLSRPPGSAENDLGSSLHDLLNTMMIPSILWIFWKRLMRAHAMTDVRGKLTPLQVERSRPTRNSERRSRPGSANPGP
jgi:hypothetical protein